MAVDSFCLGLPKVELHCHLLGTVSRRTFTDLVQRENAPIAPAEIDAFFTPGDRPVGAIRVLRALERWLIRRPDDLHRLTVEYLLAAAAHNVRYAEFFWNPTGTTVHAGIDYAAGLDAIAHAIREAGRDAGIVGRLIPSIDREAPPAEALAMVEQVIAHRREVVVGIGIDYREADGPPGHFAEAYARARGAGLRTTAHAGEFGLPWQNVATALDVLRVDRLDHAYTVVDNPALAARIAERGLVVTVVPTNSYYRRTLAPERWALDHPIRRMPGLGLKIHPNTDDPTLHHVTPTEAWTMMTRDFGFGRADLRRFMHNGLDGAWIDDATRRAWRLAFDREFDRLDHEHPT